MKSIFIGILTFVSLSLYTQEFRTGGGIGILNQNNVDKLDYFVSVSSEYKPIQSFWSFNFDPSLFVHKGKLVATAPLYLKLMFGKNVMIGPSVGLFIRTNKHYGWLTGINVDIPLDKGLFIVAYGNYYVDYWKERFPTHYGESYEDITSDRSVWIAIGLKKDMLY
jgi:hypothetical protein